MPNNTGDNGGAGRIRQQRNLGHVCPACRRLWRGGCKLHSVYRKCCLQGTATPPTARKSFKPPCRPTPPLVCPSLQHVLLADYGRSLGYTAHRSYMTTPAFVACPAPLLSRLTPAAVGSPRTAVPRCRCRTAARSSCTPPWWACRRRWWPAASWARTCGRTPSRTAGRGATSVCV